jgi:hypothetical protein
MISGRFGVSGGEGEDIGLSGEMGLSSLLPIRRSRRREKRPTSFLDCKLDLSMLVTLSRRHKSTGLLSNDMIESGEEMSSLGGFGACLFLCEPILGLKLISGGFSSNFGVS